ncbi:MAG: RidA family protein [Alphaproteobacteria bacterium]|jgi:enamine deaminase RidA (YjgF/YER057c/UK114 family)|nr:RidA family protein [Alphaproteobacteria bacterium]MDP6518007.1 RidA family protein [Alphaproteobacteria bacterium]
MAAIERFMVPGQHEPVSHYCHAVRAGDRIWISGTVGIAADGTIPTDTVAQFELAMANLDAVLRAAGGAPRDIVKVCVYLTDIEDRARINPIRQDYFGDHRPASTLVEISKLVLPELTVEIEAEAVISD